MSVLRTLLVSASAALVMAGCASGPSYKEVAGTFPAVKPDSGRIFFFRSNSMVGAALQPDIRLNDEVVGESKPGGFFFIDKPAGKYTVATATETEKTLSFALDSGETKYVRTSPAAGVMVGRVEPTLETPDVGQKEVEELHFTGGAKAPQEKK
ncbi:MAG: DUF2846 domain-containing protein [Rhodocyclaceae bacterium]